jgi:cobalamin biosynthesis protein CobT
MTDEMQEGVAAEAAPQILWNADGSLATEQPPDEPEFVMVGPDGETLIGEENQAVDDEDYSDILTPQEIRNGGGFRRDETRRRYWLDKRQLAEFTRMDDSMGEDDDEKFWGWFKAFREANGIKADNSEPPPKQKQRRGLETPKWNDYWDSAKSKTKKYLSDWWGGSSYMGYASYGGDQAKKLAVALQAVQSTIRVVDNNVRRMRVQFSRDDGGAPQSFTSYNERLISVSPQAVLDKEIADGDAIDITTGMALHEASHAEYSEGTLHALEAPFQLKPLAVAAMLHNLFEDMRIDSLTSREFPGFTGYFERRLRYLWPHVAAHAPKEFGPDLTAKVNAIIAGVKWAEDYKVFAENDNADLATEMQWWRDLAEQYSSGFREMREVLELAMARLREDEKTKEEMEKAAKGEQDAQAGGTMTMPFSNLPEAVRQAIEKFAKENGGLMQVCESPEHSVQKPLEGKSVAQKIAEKKVLPATLGQQVSELADSELEIENTQELKIPELGNRKTEIMTLHPLETPESRAKYTPPLRGLVSRMRNAFFFRPVAQQWTTRLQRSGSIDDDELWRAAPAIGKERDFRVFQQHNIDSSPDTSITLLVDISGSMNGEKMRTAIQAASVMHEVLKSTPGVRVRVRAHTGDVPPATGDQSIVYKVWESGEPLSRMGIPLVVRHGNNYDGYAIGWCVTEMERIGKPEEQRLLIVLSDGLPHGRGYGGEEAMRHVKEVQRWARRRGVDVIQIAIDPAMDPIRQAKMFDHFVPFTNIEALPGQLTNILKKAIK